MSYQPETIKAIGKPTGWDMGLCEVCGENAGLITPGFAVNPGDWRALREAIRKGHRYCGIACYQKANKKQEAA